MFFRALAVCCIGFEICCCSVSQAPAHGQTPQPLAKDPSPTAQAVEDSPTASSPNAAANNPPPANVVPTPSELMELSGESEASLRAALAEADAPDGGPRVLLAALGHMRSWPAELWEEWRVTPPQLGWLHGSKVSGRLKDCQKVSLSPELMALFPDQHLYRCEIESSTEPLRTWSVYCSRIPNAWQDGRAIPSDAQVKAFGLTPSNLDRGATLATRIEWHLDTPLGALGVDMGLLDDVKDGKPLSGQEREAFYQFLSATSRDKTNLLGNNFQPDSVVPLFNNPASKRGDRVLLQGTARRVIRVETPEPDIRARFGITHYYEVDLITPDSQNNPIVLCLRSIPPGMAEGGNVRERLRVQGFFLKTWAYRSGRPPQMKNGVETRPLQLAPLILVSRVARLNEQMQQAKMESTWSILAFTAIGAGLLAAAIWASRHAGPKRQLPSSIELPNL